MAQAKLNVTGPDSRVVKDKTKLIQGYNAQVIASPEQVILAAGLTQDPNDSRQLPVMVSKATQALHAAGIEQRLGRRARRRRLLERARSQAGAGPRRRRAATVQ